MLYNSLATHGYLNLGKVEILISRLCEKVGCLIIRQAYRGRRLAKGMT